VEVTGNARKRGFTDAELQYVWENAVRFIPHVHDGEDRWLVIGPLPDGRFAELVAVPYDGPTKIIHANLLQRNHYGYLTGDAQ
jgi:uncharacterized DUF497 family protein